jgi:molybdopterin converting factor small subunit
VKVRLPSPLDAYTGGLREVEFPGVRFRIVDENGRVRPHINVFVNEDLVTDLGRKVAPADEVMIVAALSGG